MNRQTSHTINIIHRKSTWWLWVEVHKPNSSFILLHSTKKTLRSFKAAKFKWIKCDGRRFPFQFATNLKRDKKNDTRIIHSVDYYFHFAWDWSKCVCLKHWSRWCWWIEFLRYDLCVIDLCSLFIFLTKNVLERSWRRNHERNNRVDNLANRINDFLISKFQSNLFLASFNISVKKI